MTTLTKTTDYLVEFEAGMLTISRYSDGHCLAMTGKRIAGDFRDCLKTHSLERCVDTFIRLSPSKTWQPMYKPQYMPR